MNQSQSLDEIVKKQAVVFADQVMFVSFGESSEAYFLAGVLSSAPSRSVVVAYTTLTGISTHVLENVSFPTFNPNDALHLARPRPKVTRLAHFPRRFASWVMFSNSLVKLLRE